MREGRGSGFYWWNAVPGTEEERERNEGGTEREKRRVERKRPGPGGSSAEVGGDIIWYVYHLVLFLSNFESLWASQLRKPQHKLPVITGRPTRLFLRVVPLRSPRCVLLVVVVVPPLLLPSPPFPRRTAMDELSVSLQAMSRKFLGNR